jgi:hypothetical protein
MSENGIQKKEINRQLDFFLEFSGKRIYSAGNGARSSSSKEKAPLLKTNAIMFSVNKGQFRSP